MVESARQTADGLFSILAYVDEDDSEKDNYPNWVIKGKRKNLSHAYQFLFELTNADIIMMCADDLIFRTKGWDTKVKSLQPKDNIFLVSYDDLGSEKEDGHPFIGRKLIELNGYLCHKKMTHS